MKILYGTITQATAQAYCQHEALVCIRKINEELDQSGPWPENLTSWLCEHHQTKLQAIHTVTEGINCAIMNQDATGLIRVLKEYKMLWLEGLGLWNSHQRLIDVVK